MADLSMRRILETSAIIVGYVMSRLDRRYLEANGYTTWKEAFENASKELGVRPASIKNLRDEFDPVHGNTRQGWHGRPLRANRQRVMGELCDLSDQAVLELVQRILRRDPSTIEQTASAITTTTRPMHNVAERLLTGRRAEEHFLSHCEQIVGVGPHDIEDFRLSAMGFDFQIRSRPRVVIEVKGLKKKRGDISFTDREWAEAGSRKRDYWVVVVGNLESRPIARRFEDPRSTMIGRCQYRTAITASWVTAVVVA